MQNLVHPDGLRNAVVPLSNALLETIPVQLIKYHTLPSSQSLHCRSLLFALELSIRSTLSIYLLCVVIFYNCDAVCALARLFRLIVC